MFLRINIILMSFVVLIAMLITGAVSVAEASDYARWSNDNMPLKVYIQRQSNINGFQNSYPVDVARAFKEWKTATRNKVDFKVINNPDDADIQVLWVGQLKKQDLYESAKGHGYVWGVTKLGNPTVIYLVTTHPVNNNQPLSSQVIYMIALHEIGHALGLWWHTSSPEDIMYPDFIVPSSTVNGSRLIANKNQGKLSSRDVRNLLALYNNNNVVLLDKVSRGKNIKIAARNNSALGEIETTGTAAASVATKSTKLNVDLGRSLAELKDNPDSYEAYNNIGLVYLENNDFDNAIASFNKAIELNNRYSKAYFNLALTFSRLKDYDKAISGYEMYLKLEPKAYNYDNVQKEIDRLKNISSHF